MAAMVESWMSELGKWKNRVQAQNKAPLMKIIPNSKLDHQRGDLEQPKIDDAVSEDSDELSESTICLLIDRFAAL